MPKFTFSLNLHPKRLVEKQVEECLTYSYLFENISHVLKYSSVLGAKEDYRCKVIEENLYLNASAAVRKS